MTTYPFNPYETRHIQEGEKNMNFPLGIIKNNMLSFSPLYEDPTWKSHMELL
uniref:Uncharacterized protein n=1 Tax=Rhizophora mucronata TaxID=61149 RepID=A0A2P2QLG5_RHIMU